MVFYKILQAKLLHSLIKSILPIFLVPFYLNIWGSDSYAEWIYYYNLCAIFALLDLGFNQFSTTHLHLNKSENKSNFQRILGVCNASYIVYFLLYVCLVALFYFFVNFFIESFNFTLFFFLGSWYFFSLLNAYLIQMYRVFNEDHVGTYFAIIYNILLYSGTAILLYALSFDLIKVASFQLLIVNVSIISTFLFLKKKYKKINYLFFNFKETKEFLYKSLYYLLYKFSTFLSVNMPIILISIFSQANILAFTLNRTLANIQGQFINVAHSSLIQNITNNSKNINLTKSFFIFSINFMFAVSSMMSLLTYLIYESILLIWLDYSNNFDSELILNYELIKLLLIYSVIYNLWKSATVFVTAINKHESLAKLYFVYSIILILTIFVTLSLGDIYMMIKSMIVLEVILFFYIAKNVVKKVLGISVVSLFKNILLNMIPLTFSILLVSLLDLKMAFLSVLMVYGLNIYYTIKKNKMTLLNFLK